MHYHSGLRLKPKEALLSERSSQLHRGVATSDHPRCTDKYTLPGRVMAVPGERFM